MQPPFDVGIPFSLHQFKGGYALLLGSGISRSAGIPTGWDVVRDLIQKVAALEGADPSEDPFKWFSDRFGADAEYSGLLERLGPTPSERNLILKRYFEPSEGDDGSLTKQPTKAHRAIAWLVKAGFIRVIITTNFDRLLEQALAAIGIDASIISSADMALGALPLVHSSCTIIKLHGDYLDSRIKNIAGELSDYEEPMKRLLGQVFDEYGLIICGWSGETDPALRDALFRSANRRFSRYWTHVTPLRGTTAAFAKAAGAVPVQISDADHFFEEIADKLRALETLGNPAHPLSPALAVAELKRYLVKPEDRIKLHDLLENEGRRAVDKLRADSQSTSRDFNAQELQAQLDRYNAACVILAPLFSTAAMWATADQFNHFLKVLRRVIDAKDERSGLIVWVELHFYPAMLLFYAAGIAACHAKRFDIVAQLLEEPLVRRNDERVGGWDRLFPIAVFDSNCAHVLPKYSVSRRAGEEFFFDFLAVALKDIIPERSDLEQAFDTFQYLNDIKLVVERNSAETLESEKGIWSPGGQYIRRYGYKDHVSQRLAQEIAKEGDSWWGVKSGLFKGPANVILQAMRCIDNYHSHR